MTPYSPSSLPAVVFDIGGVLIDWNPRHLYRKLFAGDDDAMERFLAEVCTPAWNHAQDAGRPFAEAVAELSGRHPQHAQLIAAYQTRWPEMVAGAIEGTGEIVRRLKRRGVRLYALTNFSTETFPLVRHRFEILDLFDGCVVSGELGVAKPDPEIYRHLLTAHGLTASSCVFIDDQPVNVAAAAALGFDAIAFSDAASLRQELAIRGLD